MKILKEVDISNWKHQTTCNKCDTELEFGGEDLVHSHVDRRAGGRDLDLYWVVCPVCGFHVIVQEAKIPKKLRLKAKRCL